MCPKTLIDVIFMLDSKCIPNQLRCPLSEEVNPLLVVPSVIPSMVFEEGKLGPLKELTFVVLFNAILVPFSS